MKLCLLILTASLAFANNIWAQVYEKDSLSVDIRYKKNFIVKEYKDLNVEIIYTSKAKTTDLWIYNHLENAYKSSFGNVYFEIEFWDTVSGSYKNITREFLPVQHPPKDFKDVSELMTYDIDKERLAPGQRRVLTFNLLDFTATVLRGEYVLKLFVRDSTLFGRDEKGKIITNSVGYLESEYMIIKVESEVHTPHRANGPVKQVGY